MVRGFSGIVVEVLGKRGIFGILHKIIHREREMTTKLLKSIVFFISFLLLFQIPIQAETSISKKRVVSLIHDDSGSMWFTFDEHGQRLPSDNWKFANYALQSLTGLLGKNDEFYVVQMTDPLNAEKINIGYGSRQREINRIAEWEDRGWTPFDTVITATERLKESASEDPSAEYWFIIVMDGVFNELDYTHIDDEDELNENYAFASETLENFARYMNEREIKFNSILVTIESFLTEDEIIQMEYFKDIWKDKVNGLHLTAEDEVEIIERINEVAALITNRDPNATESSVDLKPRFNGNEVTIESPYPLRRMTVLQQAPENNVSAELIEIIVNNSSTDYSINGPFQMKTPYDIEQLRGDLFGSVSHVAPVNTEEVIPAGSYTLVFDEEITSDQQDYFHFIAESAIDFHVSLLKPESDGTYSTDRETFFFGADMVMEVELVSLGEEEKKITFPNLNADTEVKITGEFNDETITFKWNEERQSFLGEFIMPGEYSEAMVTTVVHGFYHETKSVPLQGVGGREMELQLLTNEWRAHLNEINDASPVQLQPYINDRPMTEEELTEVFETVQVNTEANINYELRQNGSIIEVVPKQGALPMFMPTGELQMLASVKGKYDGEEASVPFKLYIEDISWWQKYGIYLSYFGAGLLFFIWLFGILKKPRFAKNSSYMNYTTVQILNGRSFGEYTNTETFKTNFFKRWFIPYKPESKNIQGIVFKATNNSDRILIAKESQSPEMIYQGHPLGEDSRKEDLLIFTNDSIVVERHNQKEIYKYEKS